MSTYYVQGHTRSRQNTGREFRPKRKNAFELSCRCALRWCIDWLLISKRRRLQYCNTLLHTTTHCTTLLRPHAEVKDSNTLQHTATHCYALMQKSQTGIHCNTLQHTTIHCTTLLRPHAEVTDSITLQHTAIHCNTLQHNATSTCRSHRQQYTATYCNTLQHTATHCNSLLRPHAQAKGSNTLQHTAMHQDCWGIEAHNLEKSHTATH